MTRIHDFITGSIPDPTIEVVVLGWSNRHGPCYECGLPAAFALADEGPLRPEIKRCSVCAANDAATGIAIVRIDPEEAA